MNNGSSVEATFIWDRHIALSIYIAHVSPASENKIILLLKIIFLSKLSLFATSNELSHGFISYFRLIF